MGELIGLMVNVSFLLILFIAWLTHIITCLVAASWGFLIAGAICFPIGIVHGVGVWFGAW